MNKPEIKHVNFYRAEGNYNLLKPTEKSGQYIFRLPHLTNEQIRELGLRISFLVDLEKDYCFDPESYTPLEASQEIQSIYDGYWMHSGKGEIKKLVDYLESIEEEQEKLRHQHEIENAKYQIHYWKDRLEKLQNS